MRRWAADGVKVQTCVTSPPYFGLRDYGHDGQIGLEETPEAYVAAMVEVFRCVRDILADDGTVWLNIGDSYAGSGKGPAGNLGKTHNERHLEHTVASGLVPKSCKPKDLIGIPWMLAFALRADGWYLRQDIIWHKPNPMPESVTDRCTKAHEYIFLFSKSPRYFFDSEAFKEPATGRETFFRSGKRLEQCRKDSGEHNETPALTRNRRSVWSVTTRPYSGAHFATYPPELIEPCVLAGTSERGCCAKCGSPWVREMQVEAPDGRIASVVKGGKAYDSEGRPLMGDNMIDAGVRGSFSSSGGATLKRTTTGWRPSCDCEGETVPCIVLDPFMGSGTTAAVAVRLGRRYLGCELNPAYADLQRKRIADVSLPLFDETTEGAP
jgi:DNA modification methylase